MGNIMEEHDLSPLPNQEKWKKFLKVYLDPLSINEIFDMSRELYADDPYYIFDLINPRHEKVSPHHLHKLSGVLGYEVPESL